MRPEVQDRGLGLAGRADLAVMAASRVVRDSLDSASHRKLVDEYFDSLPGEGGVS